MSVFYYLSFNLFSDRGKGECAVCLPIYGHNSLFHYGTLTGKLTYVLLLAHYSLSFTSATHL